MYIIECNMKLLAYDILINNVYCVLRQPTLWLCVLLKQYVQVHQLYILTLVWMLTSQNEAPHKKHHELTVLTSNKAATACQALHGGIT